MADNTQFPPVEEILAQIKMSVVDDVESGVLLGFNTYNEAISTYREARPDDKPSMKKAAENFEANEDTEELADEVLDSIRSQVFEAVSQDSEVAVLLYSALKDYAQDHIKIYRDAVLRGYTNSDEDDENESDFVLPYSREELESIKKMTENLLGIAEAQGIEVDIPRKKSKSGVGNPKFLSIRGYGEVGSTSDSGVTETRFSYELDGEEVPATTLADVALWHVSDAVNVVTSSDIMKMVREQSGNSALSDGWTVEVNGHILTATPVRN